MAKPLYRVLAETVCAAKNCAAKMDTHAEWHARHMARIQAIMATYAPSGTGIDNGVSLAVDRSTGEVLRFDTAFHHMTEGAYDGWTEHTVTVKGSLMSGFDLHISGRDRNEIKDYLADVFDTFLTTEILDPSEITREMQALEAKLAQTPLNEDASATIRRLADLNVMQSIWKD